MTEKSGESCRAKEVSKEGRRNESPEWNHPFEIWK